MNLLISDNTRCVVAEDGTMWSPDAARGYDAWEPYLGVFDEVKVLVRARRLARPPDGWVSMCGPGVHGVAAPHFVGPWQLAPRYAAVKRAIRNALHHSDAVSLRLPATLSQLVWGSLEAGRPYGVHVTGDPFEALAPGLHGDLSRGLFRHLYTRRLLRQTAGACAVAYVTAETLQQAYPPPRGVFSTHFSNAVLPGSAYVPSPREPRMLSRPFRIVMVGSMANLIKRPDVLMESVGICLRSGVDVRAAIIGDGRYRPRMEARCQSLGLRDYIAFTGQLPSAADVRNRLDQADLFVLPSETEGLPRAMLEAMARALPCIGTAVGGIPELLPPGDLVPPGDPRALAGKIMDVCADTGRLAAMSRRSLESAREYRDVCVSRRRADYCQAVRTSTEGWLAGRVLPMEALRSAR